MDDIVPRMEGDGGTADDDVTIAAGQLSAGHGDDPMGEGAVSERARDRCGRAAT